MKVNTPLEMRYRTSEAEKKTNIFDRSAVVLGSKNR
jgi:hypothetical protein